MILTSVDLPAPFSPTSTCASPWRRSKLTSWSATTPGNRFEIPRSSSTKGCAPESRSELGITGDAGSFIVSPFAFALPASIPNSVRRWLLQILIDVVGSRQAGAGVDLCWNLLAVQVTNQEID